MPGKDNDPALHSAVWRGPGLLRSPMKARSREKTISALGVRRTRGKAQSESKVGMFSGIRPKPGGRRRAAADKLPPSRQSGRDSTVRPGKPSVRAAVRSRILGIGASAGGLQAFTELLEHLPADTGMGFVLVQHLDPPHPSALPQLLSRATSMPVREVSHDLAV